MSEPKRRMVFSDRVYSDPEYIKEMTQEMKEINGIHLSSDDFELIEIIDDYRQEDWANEMDMLKETLGDSELLVFGSIGRWDGTYTAWDVEDNFEEMIQNTMKDCESFEIWDENGHLFVEGIHHDGRNTVEVRMLDEDGVRLVERWQNGDALRSLRVEHVLDKLKQDYAMLPRHAEKAYGCPVEEWEEKTNPDKTVEKPKKAASLGDEAKDASRASQVLGDDGRDVRASEQGR